MSYSEHAKATVKIVVTGPDGKVLRVIEGESQDPFSGTIMDIYQLYIGGIIPSLTVYDPFGNPYDFDLVTPSPSTLLGYLIASICLTDCPNAGSTPPNGPGIWLFSSVPSLGNSYGWSFYTYTGVPSTFFISGLSYSPVSAYTYTSSPSSPGDIVYSITYVTQSITNNLSSPVNVYTITLVGAVYGSLSTSPVYIPITFYVFSPPIVLSPGVTMTVTITLSFPIGIAVTPVTGFATLALRPLA
jgi:hypothetical protein